MWTWILIAATALLGGGGVMLLGEGICELYDLRKARRATAETIARMDTHDRALFSSLQFPDDASEQAFFDSEEWKEISDFLFNDVYLGSVVGYYGQQAKR